MKINLKSITVMLGLFAVVSIMVPTQMQTQTFASTDEPDVLNIREVGNNGNNAEMAKMTVKEGNQPSQKEDDFELNPEENAIFVPQGKNVEVTDDESFFRAIVVQGDTDKQIPISQQGVVDLKGLAQGFYYLDGVIQDGETKVAYEAILYIGPKNAQSEDTVNKEVNRVDKDVTITKRITNIDRTVQCGKDQKFNDKTKKCENIPPPICKPGQTPQKDKCTPKPPTKTPTPPPTKTPTSPLTPTKTLTPTNPLTPTKPLTPSILGPIVPCPQFSSGQCIRTATGLLVPIEGPQIPPSALSKIPESGPGESCTLAGGLPGRVTGTQAQGNLGCEPTGVGGATTAPTGPVGSDCALPGGNTGGKVTNTGNGLACIAGTKPPTPTEPPSIAALTPEPRGAPAEPGATFIPSCTTPDGQPGGLSMGEDGLPKCSPAPEGVAIQPVPTEGPTPITEPAPDTGQGPELTAFCQDPANANAPECQAPEPPTDQPQTGLVPPPQTPITQPAPNEPDTQGLGAGQGPGGVDTEIPDPDAALFGEPQMGTGEPGTEQGTETERTPGQTFAGPGAPQDDCDLFRNTPECPPTTPTEPGPEPTPTTPPGPGPEPEPITCEDGTVVTPPEECPSEEPPTKTCDDGSVIPEDDECPGAEDLGQSQDEFANDDFAAEEQQTQPQDPSEGGDSGDAEVEAESEGDSEGASEGE